jgi:HD-like signal output (HDOD) protein/CheY-like chemotaxis protein
MARVLIIDDTPLFREPMSASLRVVGLETETAADGKEGIRKARARTPDLILLDLAMPGMDGLEVARICRADPAIKDVPILLLSAVADRQCVIRAAKLGIDDFLLKTQISMTEMLQRIYKHLGSTARKSKASSPAATRAVAANCKPAAAPPPREFPVLLTRERCLDRVERATAARALSGVVAQVLSMAGSPSVEMSELAVLIGRDPVLSARVLRAANSAAFAGAKKVVTTIQEAVRNIGLSALRNIATALSVCQAIPAGAADGFHYIRSWQHSLAAALICQHLVATSKSGDTGAAYLIGLCHDLGQILFRGEFGREYNQVLKIHAETGRPLDQLERQMLGATQLDLAKVILKKLALPEGIRHPIEEFHALKLHPTHEPTLISTRLLRLADVYSNGLLMAALPTSKVGLLEKSDCKATVGREDPPRPDSETLRGQILALTPLLARLPEEDERKLSQPMLENSGKTIRLVRDPTLSSFDPLETALSALGEVTVGEAFPLPDEARQFDLIVVAARQRYPLPASGQTPVLRLALDDPPPPSGIADPAAITEYGSVVTLEQLAAFISLPSAELRKVA